MTNKKPKSNNRWQPPRSYTADELRQKADAVRESMMQIEAICTRMDQLGLPAIEIPGGHGAAAYERLSSAVQAWITGVSRGFRITIEKPP